MARTVQQIDEAIEKLKAERKEALEREKALEAEGEVIAKEKIGEIALSFYPKGWRAVDPAAFARFMKNHRKELIQWSAVPTVAGATAEWKRLNVKKLVNGLRDAEARTGASDGEANA